MITYNNSFVQALNITFMHVSGFYLGYNSYSIDTDGVFSS
jgi:hypothetical protein